LETSLNGKQDKLTAGSNITIDSNNMISLSGGITQSQLDLKQDKLTAWTNITIDVNDNISSSGGFTQSQLDTKQNTLTTTSNITTGTISSGNITGRTSTTITGWVKNSNYWIKFKFKTSNLNFN